VLVVPGTLLVPEVALAGASVQIEDDFMEILNEGVKSEPPVSSLKNTSGSGAPWCNDLMTSL
jgi:hypothetical protein